MGLRNRADDSDLGSMRLGVECVELLILWTFGGVCVTD